MCWLFQAIVLGPGPWTNYKVWALGRFSGLAGHAEFLCSWVLCWLCWEGLCVAHLLGMASAMGLMPQISPMHLLLLGLACGVGYGSPWRGRKGRVGAF